MRQIIKIGSRDSVLAMRQTQIVKDIILKNHPEIQVEIVTMKTTGDRILNRNLDEIGGKGLFVKELDHALMNGQVDLTVHSLKDMPMEQNPKLPILAYTSREDARDALLLAPGCEKLSRGSVIGTSSRRRMLQLQKLYPHCVFKSIRGNLQTRMQKLETENYDGIVLAMAGINRLGIAQKVNRIFSMEEVIPAAGQGIMAVQGRTGEMQEYLAEVMDDSSKYAALCERSFVRTLDGGCSAPIAAYARKEGESLLLTGLYYEEESGNYYVGKKTGQSCMAEQLGESLANEWKNKFCQS